MKTIFETAIDNAMEKQARRRGGILSVIPPNALQGLGLGAAVGAASGGLSGLLPDEHTVEMNLETGEIIEDEPRPIKQRVLEGLAGGAIVGGAIGGIGGGIRQITGI